MSIYVDIRRRAGEFQLDVAFEAGRETLALLGDSGCGKSMTLRCIAGVLRPDEGVIRIDGETVFDSVRRIDRRPQRRRVGYLFQNYALFPNMTVTENIMTGLERERGLSRAQRRAAAEEYIQRLHLEELEDHYPAQLSGPGPPAAAAGRALFRPGRHPALGDGTGGAGDHPHL